MTHKVRGNGRIWSFTIPTTSSERDYGLMFVIFRSHFQFHPNPHPYTAHRVFIPPDLHSAQIVSARPRISSTVVIGSSSYWPIFLNNNCNNSTVYRSNFVFISDYIIDCSTVNTGGRDMRCPPLDLFFICFPTTGTPYITLLQRSPDFFDTRRPFRNWGFDKNETEKYIKPKKN